MIRAYEPLPGNDRDRGAILVLALAFLLVASLAVLAFSNFAITAEANTTTLHDQRYSETDAESIATLAIQQLRVSYNFPGSANSSAQYLSHAPTTCTPTGVSQVEDARDLAVHPIPSLGVACEAYQNAGARQIFLQVCAPGSGFNATSCATQTNGYSMVLSAEASYVDLTPGLPLTSDTCTPVSSGSCGLSMAIGEWDVRIADS